MDEARLKFAEDFGVFFEQNVGSRMLGRVLGLLLVSEPPERTAEEIATLLKASRGSISQATRHLIQMGMVQRISKPGIRADYFRAKPDTWDEITRRSSRMMAAYRAFFERGLALMEGDSDDARQALEEGVRAMSFWEHELRVSIERWRQESERRS